MKKESTPESRWEQRVLIRTVFGWIKNWKQSFLSVRGAAAQWLFNTNAGLVVLMFLLVIAFMAVAAIEQLNF